MKERGMIFNGEMVRAILDGRKTQTRRPEIYLPRKRPEDGVIVFARTAAGVAVECE